MEKLCSSCHRMLLRKQFQSNRAQPDGLANYCRECTKNYQATWREKRRQEAREYGVPMQLVIENTIQDGECLIWTGRLHEGGYAMMSYHGAEVRVHVGVWVGLNGPKPEGMDLDHTCRRRNCINPNHLELVTRQINLLRGIGIPAINAAKEFCPYNHPLDGVKFPTPSRKTGGRYCKECARLRAREYARRKAGKIPRSMIEVLEQGRWH